MRLPRFVTKPLLIWIGILITRMAIDIATGLRTFPLAYHHHSSLIEFLYTVDVLFFGIPQAFMYMFLVAGPLLHWSLGWLGWGGWLVIYGAFLACGLVSALMLEGARVRLDSYHALPLTVFVVIALLAAVAPPSIMITGWLYPLGGCALAARYLSSERLRYVALASGILLLVVGNLVCGLSFVWMMVPSM